MPCSLLAIYVTTGRSNEPTSKVEGVWRSHAWDLGLGEGNPVALQCSHDAVEGFWRSAVGQRLDKPRIGHATGDVLGSGPLRGLRIARVFIFERCSKRPGKALHDEEEDIVARCGRVL